jgi:hypothetical protein
VSVYVLADRGANINGNGNFIWSFSNSNDIISHKNGCMFFSARNQGYSITKTDYNNESGVCIGQTLPKGEWKHVDYTQTGDTGKIYIDGDEQESNEIDLIPSDLSATKFNYLGRSPYKDDNYFKGLIADFRIYDKALNTTEIKQLANNCCTTQSNWLKKKRVKVSKNNKELQVTRII